MTYLLFTGLGNILKLINLTYLLIEWLWRYEYFVNLRKIAHSANTFNKAYLIYNNVMLFLATTDNFILITLPLPHQRLPDLF